MNLNLLGKPYLLVGLGGMSFEAILKHAKCKEIGVNLSGAIKIDTGCAITRLNLKSLLPEYSSNETNNARITELKLRDIRRFKRGEIKCSHSVGVNTVREELDEVEDMTEEEMLEDRTLCFHHKITDLNIGGYYIGNASVKINYDSNRNSLLGMNMLKKFEYYCGTSLINDFDNEVYKGGHVFLGRLKDAANTEKKYIEALSKYFGIPERSLRYIRSKAMGLEE